MGIRTLIIGIIVTILIGCSVDNISSGEETLGIKFAISKPRTTLPDEVFIELFKDGNIDPIETFSDQWYRPGNTAFSDLEPGWYRVNVYGKNGGYTILEGKDEVEVRSGDNATAHVVCNVFLRSIFIDNNQEDQFSNSLNTKAPFWDNIPNEGAATFQLDNGDNVNVSTLSTWGSRGIYFLFRITDKNFNAVGGALSNIGQEWLSDALILYLSTGLSVNEVEDNDGMNFFDSYLRVMVEVGNSDIQNSKVKLERYSVDFAQNKVQDMDEEFQLNNINSQNFNIKIIEDAGSRFVVVFINKNLITKGFNVNPKIGAMFRYRNADINDGPNVIGWKGNNNIDLGNDLGGWGNIKLVGS